MMGNRREIRPQAGPQETWLSSAADIAVYGGAAGGGKTWALLLEPLRHVANPRFGAVIFRRTSPQITNEGGLWDAAGELYPFAGATARVGTLDWVFPSGANIGFRHLQHEANKFDWQGTEVPMLGFDELTHFRESQFFYLLSRNRSTCGVRPYVRATTNPEPGWVKRLLAPWVDRTFAEPAASGEVRWFVRVEGKIVWGQSREELVASRPDLSPKSITFVRASVFDNGVLLSKDPGYLANLQALPTVEQARLLHGDWDVMNEGLVYPDFGGCVVEPEAWPAAIEGERVGGIDWGWHNPFAAVRGTLDRDDVLWLDWERHGSHVTLGEHAAALSRSCRWHADPAGADQVAELRAAGLDVIPCVHLGQQPLLAGIAAVTARMRSGRLKVRGTLGHLIAEAGLYRYDPDKQGEQPIDRDNHALAALRYLVVAVDRGMLATGRTRGETAEERFAREEAEAAERRAESRDPDHYHWWGDDDD